jgi:hypothetical protein
LKRPLNLDSREEGLPDEGKNWCDRPGLRSFAIDAPDVVVRALEAGGL